MNDLSIVNGNIEVSSLQIADWTGKEHKQIMREIREELEELGNNVEGEIFTPSSYINSQNKVQPCYKMNRDGVMQLALKYDAVVRYKVIQKLNELESQTKAPASIEDLIIMQAQSVKEIKIKVYQIEENSLRLERANLQLVKEVEINKHRIDALDCTNIEGTPRQRLVSMVKKYAFDNGIIIPKAWEAFKTSFNIAYRKNIQLLKSNYCKANKKDLTLPEYLEQVGLIEDALRVAEKMLNQHQVQYTAR